MIHSKRLQDSYWQFDDRFNSVRGERMPRLVRHVGYMFCGIFLLIAIALSVTPWVQTTSGFGEVTAIDPSKRQHELHTLVDGRVDQWFVHDGDRVAKGDPIVRILDNDPKLVQRLNAELDALRAQREAAKLASNAAELDYARKQNLHAQGLASRRDMEQASIRMEERRAAESEIVARLARASVSLAQRTQQVVTAPSDGMIIQTTAADTATWVTRGAAVASFLPRNDQPAVALYISGRDAPLVVPGRKVRLQFDGWPAVQFSGWPSVATGTFGGLVSVVEATARPDGRFRVFVVPDPADEPWPDEQFVRFGAKARGWVQLDTVVLGYELWRVLNQFPPKFIETQAADRASGPAEA